MSELHKFIPELVNFAVQNTLGEIYTVAALGGVVRAYHLIHNYLQERRSSSPKTTNSSLRRRAILDATPVSPNSTPNLHRRKPKHNGPDYVIKPDLAALETTRRLITPDLVIAPPDGAESDSQPPRSRVSTGRNIGDILYGPDFPDPLASPDRNIGDILYGPDFPDPLR